MTIRDMHIEIKQGINQIAAQRARKLQPEELDFVINKISRRFIREQLRPRADGSGGFEIDQLGVDNIRTLIVPNAQLPAWYQTSYYQCILPSDYEYLLSDWSYVNPYGTPTPEVTGETLKLHQVKQNLSAKGSSPFYVTETVTLDGNVVQIPADLPYGNTYAGVVKKEDLDSLIPFIRSRYNWYWEHLGNLYVPYTWLSLSTTSGTNSIVIDSGTSLAGTVTDYVVQKHTGTNASQVPNRLTSSSKLHNLLSTPYYRSSINSPVSELAGRELHIHRDNSFTIVGAGISYVRKFVPVSLSLGCNSELPDPVHPLLCDLVIEYLLSTFNTPNVQFKQQDIASRVTL